MVTDESDNIASKARELALIVILAEGSALSSTDYT